MLGKKWIRKCMVSVHNQLYLSIAWANLLHGMLNIYISVHKNYDDPWDKKVYSLIAKTQLTLKANNALQAFFSLISISFYIFQLLDMAYQLYFYGLKVTFPICFPEWISKNCFKDTEFNWIPMYHGHCYVCIRFHNNFLASYFNACR